MSRSRDLLSEFEADREIDRREAKAAADEAARRDEEDLLLIEDLLEEESQRDFNESVQQILAKKRPPSFEDEDYGEDYGD